MDVILFQDRLNYAEQKYNMLSTYTLKVDIAWIHITMRYGFTFDS